MLTMLKRGKELNDAATEWVDEYLHIPEYLPGLADKWIRYMVRRAFAAGYYAAYMDLEDNPENDCNG